MSLSTFGFLTPIVLALMAGIGWLIKWMLDRPARVSAGQLTLSQAYGAFSEDLRADNTDLRTRLEALNKRFEALTATVEYLRRSDENKADEITALRRDLTAVATEVVPLVAWIDAGSAPPPPTISARLRRLLELRHEPPDPGVPGT